jgi:hypothetical protein
MSSHHRYKIFSFVLFLAAGFLLSCNADTGGGSQGSLTLRSPSFPEIQGMSSKVSASLEIGVQTCPLAVDSDTTLSGQCSGLPLGSHSYTLAYLRSDLGVVVGKVEGSATLEGGKNTVLALAPVTKNQDDDQDRYSNLVEAMFETDPKEGASMPSVPPFAPAAAYNIGQEPSHLALGDLNRDGVLDVATANRAADSLSVLLGNPDGTLRTAVDHPMASTGAGPRNPEGLAVGDLNGDSNPDLLAVNSGADGGFKGDLAVFLGKGDGAFHAATFYPAGEQPIDVALGRLNGDDAQDVVIANFESGDVTVLLGNGDGTFQPPVSYPTGAVSAVALGDLNGDGRLDVVASIFFSQSLGVLLGNGDGTFQAVASRPVGIISFLALADLNEDGRLDVAASIVSSQTVAVLLGNGTGTFQPSAFYAAGHDPGPVTLKDLDKDGNLDLLTSNDDGMAALLLGQGDGTFRLPVFFEMGRALTSVAPGDLNGDGGFDFIATDKNQNTVSLLITR